MINFMGEMDIYVRKQPTNTYYAKEKVVVPIDQVIKDALTVLHRPDFQPNEESDVERRADLTNYLFMLIKSTQERKLDKGSVEGILRLVG